MPNKTTIWQIKTDFRNQKLTIYDISWDVALRDRRKCSAQCLLSASTEIFVTKQPMSHYTRYSNNEGVSQCLFRRWPLLSIVETDSPLLSNQILAVSKVKTSWLEMTSPQIFFGCKWIVFEEKELENEATDNGETLNYFKPGALTHNIQSSLT